MKHGMGCLRCNGKKEQKARVLRGRGFSELTHEGYERWKGGAGRQSNQRAPGAEALRPVRSDCSKHLKTYGMLTWPESVSN